MTSTISRGALAALGMTLSATAAQADPVPLLLSQQRSFGAQTFSVTDAGTPGNNVATSQTSTSNSFVNPFAQFDTAAGVLTGVNLVTAVDYSSRVTLGAPTGGSTFGRSSQGFGNGQTSYAIPFASGTAAQAASAVCSTSGGPVPFCPTGSNTLTGPVTSVSGAGGSSTVATANLAAYAGTGSFAATRTVTVTAREQLPQLFLGYTAATARYDFTVGVGTISVDYTYLRHATSAFAGAPGQSSITLDLGSVVRGANAAALAFAVGNSGDANTTGLDLDSIVGSGDTGRLTTTASRFTNLAAGGLASFFASLDTSQIGRFAATYRFNFSDADIGVGQRMSQLTLNLLGNVEAEVPEPASLALLGLGVLGLAGRCRRFR